MDHADLPILRLAIKIINKNNTERVILHINIHNNNIIRTYKPFV